MGRVYFSTRNDIGVRTLSGNTLSGDDYVGFRAPAEPAPRGANNPVNLGVYMYDGIGARSEMIRSGPLQNGGPVWPGPMPVYKPPVPIPTVPGIVSTAPPIASPPVAVGPISSSGGGGQIPVTPIPPAAPVSQQTTPTPQVSVPPAPSTGAVLITSGGGTASPAAAPAAAAPASTGFVDSIATWLGGSTAIGSYSVPNALLAGIVVLGFAWLEGGGSTGKRR